MVDNASDPPITREQLPDSLPDTALIRSDANGGPAGGYALGLAEFLASGYRHAWVLDDDMLPDHDCLERLWVVAGKKLEAAYVFPVSHQVDGSFGAWPSWCGFLVAREIIEKVGLPMEELFWWAEDTEYLQWRIPEAGYPIRVVGDATSITTRSATEKASRSGSTTTRLGTCCMCTCTSSAGSGDTCAMYRN